MTKVQKMRSDVAMQIDTWAHQANVHQMRDEIEKAQALRACAADLGNLMRFWPIE